MRMDMKQPEVSVIIPVYNLEKYVARAVESLKAQTFADFEAIVVNDGSTDDTCAVLARAAGDDCRFVIVDKPNGGAAMARKTGIERAAGRYLCFLDGDDYLEPDFLERLVTAADDAHCDVVRCNGYIRVAPDYKKIVECQLPENESGYSYIAGMLCGRETACLWDKLYARHLFTEHRLKHYSTRTGEDLLLNLQIACRNTRMVNIDYAGYNYVQRRGSAVHDVVSLEQSRELLEAVEEIFSNNPEAAQAVGGEMLYAVRGVWEYCRYIERSRNRWAGDEPFVKDLRARAERHRAALRENLPVADRMMFSLDRRRVLRPAVLVISTVRRWMTSLERRLSGRKRG